ncbi:MAG TPA: molybdate transporter family protein, partial [Polyangiaceae bacterium]
MLLLAVTGGLELLAKIVPRAVVRGIQVGLGVTLATIALRDYASEGGWRGYAMAGVAFLALLALRRQKQIPGPLVVVGAGAVFALIFRVSPGAIAHGVGLSAPHVVIPTATEFQKGALLLALPQLPLSLGNSVFATSQTARDLFPERPVTVRRIGITYALMNLIGPLFGGVPVCHGCGGLVGFHAFGARTGGAPILYGAMYLVMGLFFAPAFGEVVRVFPLPILAVVLVVEAVGLMVLVRDVMSHPREVWIAMLVAVAVVGLPYGYLVGLVLGTALWWAGRPEPSQGAS